MLDILFEENHYQTLLEKPIKNDLLLTDGEDLTVRIPDVNSILGDKLTAFAPHTTGIPFGVDKELEIIKQLYDCYTLSKEMTNYAEVLEVYKSVAVTELGYRGMGYSVNDKLSFKGARGINYLRKVNLDCYAYVAAAVRLLGDEVEEVVYSFEGYAGEK